MRWFSIDSKNYQKTGTEMKDQPDQGELVLHCEHIPKEGNVDVVSFYSEEAVPFRRKDKSQGHTHWILCCNGCFAKSEGDINKIPAIHEMKWNNKITYHPGN